MIIEVILISVIIALIRRGKIDHITKYEVKLKVFCLFNRSAGAGVLETN